MNADNLTEYSTLNNSEDPALAMIVQANICVMGTSQDPITLHNFLNFVFHGLNTTTKI